MSIFYSPRLTSAFVIQVKFKFATTYHFAFCQRYPVCTQTLKGGKKNVINCIHQLLGKLDIYDILTSAYCTLAKEPKSFGAFISYSGAKLSSALTPKRA